MATTKFPYDPVWVREPRLMVPRMAPVGKTKVDTIHSIASNLGFFWSASEPYKCFCNGRVIAASVVGTISYTGSSSGLAMFTDGSWSDGTTPKFTGLPDFSGGLSTFSAFLVFSFTVKTPVTGGIGFARGEYGMSIGWNQEYGKPTWSFRSSSGTWIQPGTANHIFATNVLHAAFITCRGGTDWSMWASGKKYTLSTNPDMSGKTLVSNTGNLYVGSQWNGSGGLADDGMLYATGFITRGLSESELQSLSADPYQFLIPA